jgi:hypothetical protein
MKTKPSNAPSAQPLAEPIRQLIPSLKPDQFALLSQFVSMQEARLLKSIAQLSSATSATYAIYGEVQGLASELAQLRSDAAKPVRARDRRTGRMT